MTNVERVTEYMEYGSPMNQLFLIEAVNRYASEVIKNSEQLRVSMRDSFINPEAWIKSATDWNKARGES